MKDNYPSGTLVRHRYFHERGLGIIVRHTKQMHPKMVVRWFSSTLKTSEHMGQVIDIGEIDNDRL